VVIREKYVLLLMMKKSQPVHKLKRTHWMYAANVFQVAKHDLALKKNYLLVDFMVQGFKREAVRHAEREYPKESTGLVVNDSYFPCRNIADDPENKFIIDPVDYARGMLIGKIDAIVHSHPQGTPVSEHDQKACKQTKLTWYVYSVPEQKWLTIDP